MKSLYSTLGFLLFVFGVLALVLSLVGVKLAILVWIDHWGLLGGLMIRFAMIIGGLLMVYLARSNWRESNVDDTDVDYN